MTRYINLLDPALRRRSPPFSFLQLSVVLAVLVPLIAAAYLQARSAAQREQAQAHAIEAQVKDARKKTAALGQEIDARKPDPDLAAEIARARTLLDGRNETLALLRGSAIGNTEGFSGYLRAFARQSVTGLWLTGFDLTEGGSEMVIDGRALDAHLLPQYIRRLNGERLFQGRSFATLRLEQPDPAAGEARDAKPQRAYLQFSLTSAAAAGRTEGRKP